jgi:hypothetical protein
MYALYRALLYLITKGGNVKVSAHHAFNDGEQLMKKNRGMNPRGAKKRRSIKELRLHRRGSGSPLIVVIKGPYG